VKARVHRTDGNAETGRDLLAAVALDLEQDEHRAVTEIEGAQSALDAIERLGGFEGLVGPGSRGFALLERVLVVVLAAPPDATSRIRRDADGDVREPRARAPFGRDEPSVPMGHQEDLLDEVVALRLIDPEFGQEATTMRACATKSSFAPIRGETG
jgi:hypothetical protein